eukprot:scaffold91729_cov42-Attheya_sp.AAC.2
MRTGTRYVNGAPPNGALLPHHPKYLEPVSSQPNSGLTIRPRRKQGTRHGRIGDQDREGRSPNCWEQETADRPPHNNKKVVVLGSMLGPSALFNTGYRHGANGDGKEPRNSRLAYRHNKNATIAYTG